MLLPRIPEWLCIPSRGLVTFTTTTHQAGPRETTSTCRKCSSIPLLPLKYPRKSRMERKVLSCPKNHSGCSRDKLNLKDKSLGTRCSWLPWERAMALAAACMETPGVEEGQQQPEHRHQCLTWPSASFPFVCQSLYHRSFSSASLGLGEQLPWCSQGRGGSTGGPCGPAGRLGTIPG